MIVMVVVVTMAFLLLVWFWKGYRFLARHKDAAFDFAWFLHQKRQPHHWQFWTLPEDEGGIKVLPMPDRYRRELLADWQGASMAQGYGWDVRPWYEKNKGEMQLHPETRQWLEEQIG